MYSIKTCVVGFSIALYALERQHVNIGEDTQVAELFGGWPVINGAYPVKFFFNEKG